MKHNNDEKKDTKQAGDVLGISDTPASTHIPQATTDHGGHPAGIEIGEHRRHTGADELTPGNGPVEGERSEKKL